jgi:hypothetical protein
MVQKPRFKDMPTKSRDWLEVECLKLAQRVLGAKKSNASQSGGCIPKARDPIGRLPISFRSHRWRSAVKYAIGSHL